MKSILILVVTISLAGCSLGNSGSSTGTAKAEGQLNEEERHRLYSAALAASDSPMDTDTFKQVCRKIGIFDTNDKPNAQYMAFVSRHVDWSMKSESDQFRREINSKEKAREYIKQHLPTR